MRSRLALSHAILLGLAAQAQGAPPPPAIVPEAFQTPIDGYDIPQLYQIWRFWIEGQKWPVIEALLAQPDEIPGERQLGRLLLSATWQSDMGRYMAADLRVYCRSYTRPRDEAGNCHVRFRSAYVPLAAATYAGDDNAVSRWMRQNFEPARLVSHLRAIDLPPQSNWWRVGADRIFSALASPADVLRENATVRRVDSRDCAPLGPAAEAMERASLGWRVDYYGLGQDANLDPPPPHATLVSYHLNLLTPRGGMIEIEGNGPELDEIARPVFAAVDSCEHPAPSDARRTSQGSGRAQ